MEKKLIAIAEKYSLFEFANEISELKNSVKIMIGFLGEFSSGKSSLINSTIGEKILPAMLEPTTKAITLIESRQNLTKNRYFKEVDASFEEIDFSDFNDTVLGRIPGVVKIQTAENDFLKDGTLFIDTPGLASLNKLDTDITFGYLPYLDGAVICQSIQSGTLLQSLKSFLSKNEVKKLAKNFIFAITQADSKPDQKSRISIKNTMIEELRKLSDEKGLNLDNLEERVFLTSDIEHLNLMSDFKLAYFKFIFDKKTSIEAERIKIELKNQAKKLLQLLEYKRSNYDLSNSDLDKKENEIKQSKEQIIALMEKESEKLELLKKDLERTIENKFKIVASSLNTNNQEEITATLNALSNEMPPLIERKVKSYFCSMEVPNFSTGMTELKNKIQLTIKTSDLCVTVCTAAACAALSGGTSLAANAAEATAGVAIKETAKAGATEALKATAGAAIKETAKAGAKEVAAHVFKTILVQIGASLTNINPLEHLGAFISAKVIQSHAETFLNKKAEEITCEICNSIRQYLETQVFEDFKNQLSNKQLLLKTIRVEKENDYKGRKQELLDLDDNIKWLSQIK